MPELPEAERARALIEREALDRKIVRVDDADTYVCRPHSPGEIDAALRGAKLTKALRRGKSIWCETDGGPDLFLHLGMTGAIVMDEEPVPWDRFALELAGGGRLALRDRRRLGRALLQPDLSHLGPDAGEVSKREFRQRVGRGTAPLKARLMDQGTVAGLGNLLVDEILWRAELSPRRPAGDLRAEELDRLWRRMRETIRDTIRHGGAHTGRLNPERRPGGACPRCGAALERGRIGGRTTWWCPREQV